MLRPLTLGEIMERQRAIEREFGSLLSQRNVVIKRDASQWRLLRLAFASLFSRAEGSLPFTRSQTRQYAHEVNQRLNNYYGLFRGSALGYRFRLVERQKALAKSFVDREYPSANGYVLVIYEWDPARRTTEDRQRDEIERALMEGLWAAWVVYSKLPDLDLTPLRERVLENSRVFKDISGTAARYAEWGWTISNPGNPSNMRILDVKVQSLTPDRAQIATKEYWLLEWWSIPQQEYVYMHREKNPQQYVFLKRGDRWFVASNRHSPPKFSAYRAKRD